MENYVIRLRADNQRTEIYALTKTPSLVGLAHTDFDLARSPRDIRQEDVVDPASQEILAKVSLHKKSPMLGGENMLVTVKQRNKTLCSLDYRWSYSEREQPLPIQRIPLSELSNANLAQYRSQGLVEAISFPPLSNLRQLMIFERNGDVSALVQGRVDGLGIETALLGLPFVLGKRVDDQQLLYAVRFA